MRTHIRTTRLRPSTIRTPSRLHGSRPPAYRRRGGCPGAGSDTMIRPEARPTCGFRRISADMSSRRNGVLAVLALLLTLSASAHAGGPYPPYPTYPPPAAAPTPYPRGYPAP